MTIKNDLSQYPEHSPVDHEAEYSIKLTDEKTEQLRKAFQFLQEAGKGHPSFLTVNIAAPEPENWDKVNGKHLRIEDCRFEVWHTGAIYWKARDKYDGGGFEMYLTTIEEISRE